jgi:glycine/D-amino acid oxidase-like deaminating enzyme
MVQYSVEFYRDLDQRTSSADAAQRMYFRQRGYLFLADAGSAARLTRRYQAMCAAGANVTWMSRDQIQERLPDAWLDDVEFGLFGPDDGYANPKSVLRTLRRVAEDAGAEYVCGEVSQISRTSDRVTGVVFGDDSIATPVVVNAAGPFAARIADLARVSLPVTPVRQQLFRCDLPHRWDYRFPMVIDPSGVHWRHDDTGVPDRIVVARTKADEPAGENFACDDSRWLAEYFPPLVRRMPSFAELTCVEGWAGLYEMTPDHSPIIGEHPLVSGFFLANGFSGHGLMMAPATGKAVAELITNATPRTIDVSVFGFDRFRAGALLPADATI